MPAVLDRLSALADLTRSRLLLVLERDALTVGELCQVLRLPQSTVSRHLKLLSDEGWVSVRAEGTSNRYRAALRELDPAARQLWQLVSGEIAQGAGGPAGRDAAPRACWRSGAPSRGEFFATLGRPVGPAPERTLRRRAPNWPPSPPCSTTGGPWATWAAGTGQVAASLAPFVRRVVAVDGSAPMLEAARQATGVVRQRGAPPGRTRGAADRGRLARRRGACRSRSTWRRSRRACSPRRRACSAPGASS